MACLALVLAGCPAEDADDPAAVDDPADAEEPAPEEPTAEPVELDFGHGFPGAHVLQTEVLEPWAAELAELSDGLITVDLHPGGALTEAPATYENTVAGVVDIGWSVQGYTAGRFPITEIIELPLLFETAEGATNAMWDLYEASPELQAEYEDVKVLALWTVSPAMLWTRDVPVTEPGDVAGLDLRVPGRIQVRMLEELGASPLSMPAGEVYDSLERGVMDGLVMDPVGIGIFNLDEVLSYAVDGGFYANTFFVAMNLDAWDELSPSQQETLDEVAGRELSLRLARTLDDVSTDVVADLDDVELRTLDEAELETWRELTRPVVDEKISELEEEGLPGQALYEQLSELAGLAD